MHKLPNIFFNHIYKKSPIMFTQYWRTITKKRKFMLFHFYSYAIYDTWIVLEKFPCIYPKVFPTNSNIIYSILENYILITWKFMFYDCLFLYNSQITDGLGVVCIHLPNYIAWLFFLCVDDNVLLQKTLDASMETAPNRWIFRELHQIKN